MNRRVKLAANTEDGRKVIQKTSAVILSALETPAKAISEPEELAQAS